MISGTVKLGDKECFYKEQIGVKGFFTDYQPFYTINQRLDKELLTIKKMAKLGVSEHEIVKIGKKERTLERFFGPILGSYIKKSPRNL